MMSDICKRSRRAERRAAPKPARIPSGAEAGHSKSCGLAVPAEEQQLSLLRGLQGRTAYSPNEGHHV
jgi:hypothetical protein